MNILSSLNKKALIATLIAATGIPASAANAQFKVEYETKAKAETEKKAAAHKASDEHVIVVKSSDDNDEYEVKVINGVVKFAQMNGKEVDHDRIKVDGESIIFLSEDGEKLTEFKVKGIAKWNSDKKSSTGWTIAAPDAPDAPEPAQIRVAQIVEQPKVMLGINLTEPSDAVRKQLKLGDRQAIFVERVIDGLPAKKAGLEAYDVIVSIDGSDQASSELLSKVLRKKDPGDPLKLIVLRGGDKMTIKAELVPYNAQKLGVTRLPQAEFEIAEDFEFPGDWTDDKGKSFTLGLGIGPDVHEKIHNALRESGVSEEQLAIIEEQLHEHLGGLGRMFGDEDNMFFFSPNAPEVQKEHEEHVRRIEEAERHRFEEQRELAAVAKEKARAAMRDAQRQVMELRDGRLVVRQAEQMEDQLAELEDRLSELEDRLEDQMDRMEEQMDRMADLFERLIDRLEDRD
ncbi:MAG: PDZ domain-containing protein [Phycisphaerales bacterium]